MNTCAAPECNRPTAKHRRYCAAHFGRLRKYGTFDLPKRPTREELFWAKVQKTDSCWLWKAAKDHLGYGRFGAENNKVVLAHRYAYELLVGPIPAGLTLDHLCRNPNCVNPAHLEPVTLAENLRRSTFQKSGTEVNTSKTHCPKGHPLSGENLYFWKGHRHCKTCKREHLRKWRESNRDNHLPEASDQLAKNLINRGYVPPQ
jgi:hypothetical protein